MEKEKAELAAKSAGFEYADNVSASDFELKSVLNEDTLLQEGDVLTFPAKEEDCIWARNPQLIAAGLCLLVPKKNKEGKESYYGFYPNAWLRRHNVGERDGEYFIKKETVPAYTGPAVDKFKELRLKNSNFKELIKAMFGTVVTVKEQKETQSVWVQGFDRTENKMSTSIKLARQGYKITTLL